MDAFVDPDLRLRLLVLIFATAAGIRLIQAGLSSSVRRWSLITGVALIALTFARELPRFLDRPRPTAVLAAEEPSVAMLEPDDTVGRSDR